MAKLLSFFVVVIVLLLSFYLFKKTKQETKSPFHSNQEQNLKASNLQDWHEFISPGGEFSVLVPALPQRVVETIKDKNTGENRKYEMYMAEKADGSLFMISVIHFPPESTQDRIALLRMMMNDVVESNPDNKLLKVESGKYGTFDSLDYSVENKEMNIDARSFIADGNVYSLTHLVKKTLHNAKEFEFFINSFKLSPSQAK